MNHFNLLMVLQTLVDFFEGYFLQQFYGDFFAERFRRKSWNQMGVVIAYVMFQYIKKLFLPTDYRMFYITENLILTFFFLLFLGLCFYKNIGLISIFLVVSFMSIQETSRISALIFPYIADLPANMVWQHMESHGILFIALIVNGTWLLNYLIRILIMYKSLKSIREHFPESRIRFPI